jgi:HD superfamily phosphohydrolase
MGESLSHIDPLHGSVNFDPWESELLNLPELQRLRYIKQTGLAFLVYPGARHTVFDHVLGTLCLAKKYLHCLGIDNQDEKILRASILLRDVGNAPLRHVLWDVESYIPKEKRETYGSDRIVQESKRIKEILEKNGLEVEHVCKMVKLKDENGDKWLHKLRPLVHGPLSFNRLDYYLRDAYYAGIKSVGFDPSNILKNIVFHEGKGLAYKEEAVPSIENVLLSRVNLYLQLYSNPEVVKVQKMLARAIQISIGENYDEFYKLTYDAIKGFLSDEEFMRQLKERASDNKTAMHIIQSIENGQLYKTLDKIYRWPELPNETRKKLNEYYQNPLMWKDAEREVASRLGVEYGQIIVDIDKPTVKDMIEKIFIKKNDAIERIDMVSPLIGSLEEEDGKKCGIMEMEKRNWFFGVYYDETIKNFRNKENQIRNVIENVYNISLPKR